MKTRILKKVTPATIWFAFFTFYHRTVSAICVCRWWGVWIERTFTATISIKEHKQITKFSTADSQEQEGCWICVWTTEQQWRILHSSILALPVTPVDIVKSWCALHNFVWGRDGYVFEDYLTCDMDDLAQAAAVGGRRTGITVRDSFSAYFSSTCAIQWLNNRVQVWNYWNCVVKFTFWESL